MKYDIITSTMITETWKILIRLCRSIFQESQKGTIRANQKSVSGHWITDGWQALIADKILRFLNNFTTWEGEWMYGEIWSGFDTVTSLLTLLMLGSTWKNMSKRWRNCLMDSDWITVMELNWMWLVTWSNRQDFPIQTFLYLPNFLRIMTNKRRFLCEALVSTQCSKKPNTCYQVRLSLTTFMILWAKEPLMWEVWTGTWRREAIKL